MIYLFVFAFVVALNIIPFFMPATWTVLALIAASYHINFFYLAIIGAVAATIGRLILAEFSRVIIRSRFLTTKMRENIDSLREVLLHHKGLSITAFLAYAFGPLPSNYIFISYGLTTLPMGYLAAPFFIGRLVSYSFWAYLGTRIALAIQHHTFFGPYFIITQLLSIGAVYWFTKVDWKKVTSRLS